ncbi:MAG: hypothetical protein K8I60_11935 [Anaerolineae bacterium]|nr:hypothetical protein [Anaerolineae bacterium]
MMTDSPNSHPPISDTPLAAGRLRLLLAALLLFGSEILVWTNPPGRSLLDWLLLAVGYGLLAVITLDLLVRYQVHDLFGAMVVMGVYSLLAGITVNPEAAFSDLPRTFITRVMGMHSFMGLEMLGLLLLLSGGERTRRGWVVGSIVVGLAWGIWVRWFPVLNEPDYGAVDFPVMLLAGAVSVALVLAALFTARSASVAPARVQLSPRGWLLVIGGLLGLGIIHAAQHGIRWEALFLTSLLLVGCYVILWFRQRQRPTILLDYCVPVQPPPAGQLVTMLILFTVVAGIGYSIPLIDIQGVNQQTIIALGFTAYGLAWLPTVALVLGARTYIHQVQTRRM